MKKRIRIIVADARASLGDLRAITRYDFKPERFQGLTCPVLLQVASESPRDLYVTDALAACLPDVCVETLVGQAHEGMTTAPEMYAASVIRFLQSEPLNYRFQRRMTPNPSAIRPAPSRTIVDDSGTDRGSA